MSEPLSWHQQQGMLRAWRTRDLPAHIRSDDYFTALCGTDRPEVTVDAEFRNNPANKCCTACKRVADKEGKKVVDVGGAVVAGSASAR